MIFSYMSLYFSSILPARQARVNHCSNISAAWRGGLLLRFILFLSSACLQTPKRKRWRWEELWLSFLLSFFCCAVGVTSVDMISTAEDEGEEFIIFIVHPATGTLPLQVNVSGQRAVVLRCRKKEKTGTVTKAVCETRVGFGARVLRHISTLLHNPVRSQILGFLWEDTN